MKTLDQKSRGIMNKGLNHWLKTTWMRWTYRWEGMNETSEINQVWTTVRNSMNIAGRKILENAVEVWADNLETEGKVRWVERVSEDERMIMRNAEVKSLWVKVKETLGTISQVLGKADYWPREWTKSLKTEGRIHRETMNLDKRAEQKERRLHRVNRLLVRNETDRDDRETETDRHANEVD